MHVDFFYEASSSPGCVTMEANMRRVHWQTGQCHGDPADSELESRVTDADGPGLAQPQACSNHDVLVIQ